MRLCIVGAGFLLLAILKTWPLVLHLGTHIPIAGDSPYHVGWMLAWGAHGLATDPRHLFDANLAYPLERSFAFGEHLLGLQLIFAPVYLLTGNPTAGYNTVFILSFALSALAAFALVYALCRQVAPALVAGTLFGFAPFRFGHIHHLHILVFFWAPLALLFLERFLRARRRRDLALFALCYWLQALSSVYLAALLTVAVGLYAGYHVAVDPTLRSRTLLGPTGAFALATVALLAPVHLAYVEVRRAWGTPWTIGALTGGSADLRAFLTAPSLMNDAYVGLSRALNQTPADDQMLFPGLLLPLLALIGACATVPGVAPAEVRRIRWAFGLVAVTATVLSLGPYLVVGGVKTPIPLPSLLFYYLVPGWDVVRIPARFELLAVLAAAPLAALGVLRCSESVSRWQRSRAWARGAPALTAAALVAGALLELGAKPMPLDEAPTTRLPAAYRWLAATRPGPILELPLGLDYEFKYLYLSTAHWLPVVSPRSSFVPVPHEELKATLAELPAPGALAAAGALGLKAIVLHTDHLSPETIARWTAREEADPRLRRLASFEHHVIYGVPTVAVTSALSAQLAAPPRMPAGHAVRLGLLVQGADGRAWAHPSPHGRSPGRLEWTALDAGRITTIRGAWALPLVIAGGEPVAVPLRLDTPASPGRYRLRVVIPSQGIDVAAGAIEVRAPAPPTSAAAPERLAATYVHPAGHDALAVPALGFLPLTLTATNTGDAVWLARALHSRGEVGLRWRWLQAGREIASSPGALRVRYDVFPGQPYTFHLSLPAPPRPGRYTVELGLDSAQVTSFADVGSAPLRLDLDVRSGG